MERAEKSKKRSRDVTEQPSLVATSPATTQPPPPSLLVAATHEGLLVGWTAALSAPSPESAGAGPSGGGRGAAAAPAAAEPALTLELAFAFRAHSGALTVLAAAGARGGVLLAGCADGAIEVFDTRARRAVGTLLEHAASVTALAGVPGRAGGHALSGDAGGALVLWRAADWAPVARLKGGHAPGAAISSIAVHASGRLALTTAADARLVLWDLSRGAAAHATPLRAPALAVRWLPAAAARGAAGDAAGGSAGGSAGEGEVFEIVYADGVEERDGATGDVVAASRALAGEGGGPGARVRSYARLPGGRGAGGLVGVAGCEGGDLVGVCLVREGSGGGGAAEAGAAGGRAAAAAPAAAPVRMPAHALRVRSLVALAPGGAGDPVWLASAGGDGVVRVWSADELADALAPPPPAAPAARARGGASGRAGGGGGGGGPPPAPPTAAAAALEPAEPAAELAAAKGFRVTDMLVVAGRRGAVATAGAPGAQRQAGAEPARAAVAPTRGQEPAPAPAAAPAPAPAPARGASAGLAGTSTGSSLRLKVKKRRREAGAGAAAREVGHE